MKLWHQSRILQLNNIRTFKNFGHKKEPIPTVTFLWHGFLTFTFMGLCLDWKRIGSFIFNKKEHDDSGT